MKKLIFFFLLILSAPIVFAQENPVQGIVFDKESKQRLNRVYLYNVRTGKGFYNNTKGEFSTNAREGDVIVAALENYGVASDTVRGDKPLIFYLQRLSIQLREVVVRDSVLRPEDQLKQAREEYADIYRKGNSKDLLQTGGSSGGGGAGLSIDALYSLVSREGKNARQLQKIIERDYREAIISYRYTTSFVRSITGLGSDQLKDFMEQYRPSYSIIIEANDYQLIQWVQNNLKNYQADPAARRLPSLKGGGQG